MLFTIIDKHIFCVENFLNGFMFIIVVVKVVVVYEVFSELFGFVGFLYAQGLGDLNGDGYFDVVLVIRDSYVVGVLVGVVFVYVGIDVGLVLVLA